MNKDWSILIEQALGYFLTNIYPVIKDIKVYPEQPHIMRAFKECPLDELKVVILGQDPYHDNSATGLCFDNVIGKVRLSPSLVSIMKEMTEDYGDGMLTFNHSQSSWLCHLPSQGVLLLNTALTVLPKQAGSHTELWKPFTELVITALNKRDDLVWILWGERLPSSRVILR